MKSFVRQAFENNDREELLEILETAYGVSGIMQKLTHVKVEIIKADGQISECKNIIEKYLDVEIDFRDPERNVNHQNSTS